MRIFLILAIILGFVAGYIASVAVGTRSRTPQDQRVVQPWERALLWAGTAAVILTGAAVLVLVIVILFRSVLDIA